MAKRKPHKCDIYSRPVGYLARVNNYNAGKREEFKNRTEYVVKL